MRARTTVLISSRSRETSSPRRQNGGRCHGAIGGRGTSLHKAPESSHGTVIPESASCVWTNFTGP